MIECKFDELAKKILDEFKQVHYSREFFQAIDVILKEPAADKVKLFQGQPANLSRCSSRNKDLDESERKAREEEKRLLKDLLDKQKELQDQLDDHQQLLIDAQFKATNLSKSATVASCLSPPSTPPSATSGSPSSTSPATAVAAHDNSDKSKEKQTNRARDSPVGVNKLATSKTTSSLDKSTVITAAGQQRKKKSAIPQSTALSGATTSSPTGSLAASSTTGPSSSASVRNPLAKSATVSGATLAQKGPAHRQPEEQRGESPSDMGKKQKWQQNGAQQKTYLSSEGSRSSILTASERIRQRRPTRATLSFEADEEDEEDSETSSEDEEVEGEEGQRLAFESVAARRACLSERLLASQGSSVASGAPSGQQERNRTAQSTVSAALQASGASNSKTTGESALAAARQTQRRQPSVQRSSTIGAGPSSNGLEQRAKFMARQQLGALSKPVAKRTSLGSASQAREQQQREQEGANYEDHFDQDPREPRSIGTVQLMSANKRDYQANSLAGPLTVGHLYKPHMNYSTSALGNHHRLSDDDEIIIIPTTRSPTISPALMGSRNCSPADLGALRHQHDHQQHDHDEHNPELDDDLSNMDELSERFSISRTKSFWEKLTSSRAAGAKQQQQGLTGALPSGEPQAHQQLSTGSTRSPQELGASGGGGHQQPALVGVRSSESSPNNQDWQDRRRNNNSSGHQLGALVGGAQKGLDESARVGSIGRQAGGLATDNGPKSGANKLANKLHRQRGQLFDSSGGSGNSNYSCSSGSGDEAEQAFNLAQEQQQTAKRHYEAQPNARSLSQRPDNNQQQQQRQTRASCHGTVAAISQQLQEMSRANRFRQTR